MKSNENYKLFKVKKNKNKKTIKIQFNNGSVALVAKKNRIFAFNSQCPHLKFDLGLGQLRKNNLTCQGHGLVFNVDSGKSTCGLFNLR